MRLLKTILIGSVATMMTCCSYIGGLKNVADCEFKFRSVSDVKIGSVDLSDKQTYKNLKVSDVAQLMLGYASKKLMLDMNVNMKVHNPNDQVAQLDGMDYILFIDEQKMLEGVTKDQLKIEAKSDGVYSLPVTLNLYDVVQDKKLQPMAEFALGLATDNADASRVKVSIKPFFTFGQDTVRFPSYITIGGDQIMPKNK